MAISMPSLQINVAITNIKKKKKNANIAGILDYIFATLTHMVATIRSLNDVRSVDADQTVALAIAPHSSRLYDSLYYDLI